MRITTNRFNAQLYAVTASSQHTHRVGSVPFHFGLPYFSSSFGFLKIANNICGKIPFNMVKFIMLRYIFHLSASRWKMARMNGERKEKTTEKCKRPKSIYTAYMEWKCSHMWKPNSHLSVFLTSELEIFKWNRKYWMAFIDQWQQQHHHHHRYQHKW